MTCEPVMRVVLDQVLHPCQIVPLHERVDPAHLWDVASYMLAWGPPTLRATQLHGRWYLHEGSHRSRAARFLRFPVIIEPTPWKWSKRGAERARFKRCLCGRCLADVPAKSLYEELKGQP